MKDIGFSDCKETDKNKNVLESMSIVEDDRSFKDLLDLKVDKEELKGINETKDIKEDEVTKIKCVNEDLEGKQHPESGVKYERKVVDDGEGNKVEGVFPQFESEFEATLDKDELKSSDIVQFNRANKQLKEAVAANPELASKFTPQQLQMIEKGMKPKGFTWHHSEEVGKLQLVDSKIHAITGHTGGQKVWGGGSENR
ncbi:HNH endonuclease [Romboutsia sp.]|uniref:HNH endonuclease n=1 Tax=Romboutsia sp. TaxID=1965302 RepID=UPI003F3E91D6